MKYPAAIHSATHAAIFLTIILFTTSANAEQNIAKCIDAQGDLTYTDYLCVTEETGDNPLLMTEDSTTPTVRAKIPSVIKAEAIAANRIQSATIEAKNECEQRFVKYFRRKHPGIEDIPQVDFNNVVDQYIKDVNVSVSLSGNVEYSSDSRFINSNIECTVQRFSANSDWLVGYREK